MSLFTIIGLTIKEVTMTNWYKYFSLLMFFSTLSRVFPLLFCDVLPNSVFIIDTTIVYLTPPGWQLTPDIAFDGTNYLVVWEDRRSGPLPYFYTDIHGGRVNKNGIVLDSGGIDICVAEGWQGSPSVAYGNGIYLVVWVDYRNDIGERNSDIYGVRIDTAGWILDIESIVISNAPGGQSHPRVAFDGTNFMVVWGDRRNGSSDIYGARINSAGIVLDTTGIPIATGSSNQFDPILLWGDSNYLVIWSEKNSNFFTICYTWAKPSGEILDTNYIYIASSDKEMQQPSAIYDGLNYFIIWQEPVYLQDILLYNIYGIRMDNKGHILNKVTTIVSHDKGQPSVGLNNSGYLVAWGGIKYAVVDSNLVTLGKSIISKTGFTPTIASDENMNFIIWSYYDIYGTRVNDQGNIIDTNKIKISIEGNHQIEPAAISDGSNYLVVWQEYRDSTYDIFGIRLNQFGLALDSLPTAISTARYDQRNPSVAFDGTNYLVVWEDGREGDQNYDIYGTRINQFGQVLDPNGFPISTAESQQWFPDIAFDGINYFVVWEGIHANSLDVFGTRVTPEGKILDPQGISISSAQNHQRLPSIAYNGENYFVAWRDQRDTNSVFQIYATRITRSGKVLNTAGIFITSEGNKPSLASDGNTVLVVWEHKTKAQVYGSRIDANGKILDPYGFSISGKNEIQNPVIVYTGKDYSVFWQEKKSDKTWGIAGAKIWSDISFIEPIDTNHMHINQITPEVTVSNSGKILVIFSGYTEKINRHAINAMRIWGELITY